ncbi:helix-turn-helix domain-containing protein [Paenibacillus terrae]|uniref:helix-turn-helix domain-containing protein n=1 Tax=Paenibacillus terrae TaxID=159743 RepID=UPI0009D9951C
MRYHRILRNLTITELAAKAGISVVALSRIERSINPPQRFKRFKPYPSFWARLFRTLGAMMKCKKTLWERK